MRATVLGKKKISFTNDLGKEINGVSVWLGFDAADEMNGLEGIEGMYVEKAFISPAIANYKDIVVGSETDVTYNSKGKIIGLN